MGSLNLSNPHSKEVVEKRINAAFANVQSTQARAMGIVDKNRPSYADIYRDMLYPKTQARTSEEDNALRTGPVLVSGPSLTLNKPLPIRPSYADIYRDMLHPETPNTTFEQDQTKRTGPVLFH